MAPYNETIAPLNTTSTTMHYLSKRRRLLSEMTLLDTKFEVSCRIATGEMGEGTIINVPYERLYGVGGGSVLYVKERVWRIDSLLSMSGDGDLFTQYSNGEWDTYKVPQWPGTSTAQRIRTFLDTPPTR